MKAIRDIRDFFKKGEGKLKKRTQVTIVEPTKTHSDGSETDNIEASSHTRPSLTVSTSGHLRGGERDASIWDDNVEASSHTQPSLTVDTSGQLRDGKRDASTRDEEISLNEGPSINVIGASSTDVLENVRRSKHARSEPGLFAAGSANFLNSPKPIVTRENSGASAWTDVTAYTTWRDNGEKFAAEYISQQTIPDETPDEHTDTSVPYVKKIKKLLTGAEIQSDWQHTATFFIPCTQLVAIINQTCVERVLEDVDNIPVPERAQIVAQICGITPPDSESGEEAPSFRKVLATLIRTDKHASILDFIKHDPPINDQVLPLYMVYNREGKRCGLALSSLRNVPIDFTTRWETDDLQNFCDIQWRMYPTFFAVEGNKDDKNHKKVHYECPAGTVLPFVHQPSPSSTWNLPNHQGPTNSRKEPITGGYGKVTFHRLHISQQNLRRYTTEGPRRLVAVKKLNNTSGLKEFQNELKMLVKLTPLPTPHLAKLLATFEIQGKTATERDYCFMSETADSNLQEFWGQDPERLSISRTELAKWVAQQCHGLADGMKEIHNYQYEQDSDRDRPPVPRHGFHGDVKPDNILVYTTWVGHKHPLGILQITDFGISSFHHTASLSGISRGRDGHAYRPPESHVPFMKTTQSHDIWTLGCLFMESLTWLVKGPAALNDFLEKRRSYGFSDNDTITTFHQVDEVQGKAVISICEEVLKWAKDLCQDPRGSKFICDFIDLIIKDMLVIEATGTKASSRRTNLSFKSPQNLAVIPTTNPLDVSLDAKVPDEVPTKRISADELVKRLEEMLDRDDGYYSQPVAQHEIPDLGQQYGTRQAITFQMSLEQLEEVSTEQALRRGHEKQDIHQNGVPDDEDKLNMIPESGYVTDTSRGDSGVYAHLAAQAVGA